MKHKALIIAIAALSGPLFAADNEQLQREIRQLQEQTKALQTQLARLQKQLVNQPIKESRKPKPPKAKKRKPAPAAKPLAVNKPAQAGFHSSNLSVHSPNVHPESARYYPTALIADGQIITYIAGTPVVSSPYLGDRPAFDGSDYIINISSINRDIRMMEQRRRLYQAYEAIGYPIPNMPIIAISGKSEPVAVVRQPYYGKATGDLTLGTSELDVAASVNKNVEAFMSIAYDSLPPIIGGQRVANSSFNLNMGFVNIGNLEVTPFYFTAGQLYVPFGRYSSALISAPLTMRMARTKSRPFIFGYKSQEASGPYAAGYAFISDVTRGHSAVGGVNLGYTIKHDDIIGDVGVGYIGSINDSLGMQRTGSIPLTTFGGFGSLTNGSENVRKVPGWNIHGNISFDRYSLTAEWVGAATTFRTQDLSFNGYGANPQAIQLEGGVTFMVFDKPSSIGVGYQWSKDTLALNLPNQRVSGVFNISIWKDTVESLEYRRDFDFQATDFANGASAYGVNLNTLGTGKKSNSLIAQIGVYF